MEVKSWPEREIFKLNVGTKGAMGNMWSESRTISGREKKKTYFLLPDLLLMANSDMISEIDF